MISVIVPIYKCEKYLPKCIESIINQTYKDIEIILVLDGVFDESDKICYQYARTDERICVIKKEHEGVSIARNVGIEKAKGNWLAFVDSDDWLEEHYLEKMFAFCKKESEIIICDYFAEYRQKTIIEKFFIYDKHLFNKYDMMDVLKNCLFPIGCGDTGGCTCVGVPWAKLYKTEFIKKNNLNFKPNLSRMQDMVFNLYAFSFAKNVFYIGEPLYHYLKNDTASTVAFNPTFTKTVYDVNDAVLEFIEVRNKKEMLEFMYAKNTLLILEIIRLQYVLDKTKSLFSKVKSIHALLKKEPFITSVNRCNTKYLHLKTKIAVFLLKKKMLFIIYLYIFYKNNKYMKFIKIK